MKTHSVDVCIVGGGPAGMVLSLLLSHQGISNLVLEQHKDFEREYRGEVLMPRFTQMFRQLGLEEWLYTLPHLKLKSGELYFRSKLFGKIDFSRAAPDVPYALWIPQTVLLNGLHERAKAFPSFDIWFGASVKRLLQDTAVQGVLVDKGGETIEVRSRVVIGADGRFSRVLKEGHFEIEYEDYNFDVIWFTIPQPEKDENTFRVMFSPERNLLLLPKFPKSIQVGILVPPKGLDEYRKAGIEKMREDLLSAHPIVHEFARNLKDFSPFHPLKAELHLVKEWAKDGCLLIGDAAHCCSPAGAIGVSVAVQTAIITADVLLEALKQGTGPLSKEVLKTVQTRREKDVRMIHRIQRNITGGLLGRVIPVPRILPIILTLLARTPFFRMTQRRLMALPEPLALSPQLGFSRQK